MICDYNKNSFIRNQARFQAKVVLMASFLVLSACKVTLIGANSQSTGGEGSGSVYLGQPQVGRVELANNVLTISGSNLQNVTSVTLEGGEIHNSLWITNATTQSVSATASSPILLALGTVYSLIVSNASASSSTTFSFDLTQVPAGGLAVGVNQLVVSSSGNVGIGVTSPNTNLQINGTSMQDALSVTSDGNTWTIDKNGALTLNNELYILYDQNVGGYAYSNYGTTFITSGAYSGVSANIILKPSDNGSVGIGTTAPGYLLDVNGDVNVASANVLRFGGTQVCASSGCTATSDRRLKENIRPLQNSLDHLLKLQGVTYEWKDKDKYGKGQQVGLIAQDLERVYPEVVLTDRKSGLKSVSYDHLIAPVIEAVKTLASRFNRLEKSAQELFEASDEQSRKLASLEARSKKLEAENIQLGKENAQIKAYLCVKDPTALLCK